MTKFVRLAVLFALTVSPVWADGNLTRRAERLDTLLIDAVDGFSTKSYSIETGVYYRWRISSDGRGDYTLVAPDLFRESWIDQVVIEDVTIKSSGFYAIEFEDENTADIWFITLRSGTYEFYVEGLKTQGFSGEFVVK